jgi:hypothetical protein
MATLIAGGASTSRKCNPKMPRASRLSKTCRYRVPSTLARRQQVSWRRNRPEPLPRLSMAVATTTSRPPSSRDVSVGAREGSADPARTSTEGAAPTTPPDGVIDRMRQGSIVGSVRPLHGPGRQRSRASAGQQDRPEGECLNVTCVQCENGRSISTIDSAQPIMAHDADIDSDLARPPDGKHLSARHATPAMQLRSATRWRTAGHVVAHPGPSDSE